METTLAVFRDEFSPSKYNYLHFPNCWFDANRLLHLGLGTCSVIANWALKKVIFGKTESAFPRPVRAYQDLPTKAENLRLSWPNDGNIADDAFVPSYLALQ